MSIEVYVRSINGSNSFKLAEMESLPDVLDLMRSMRNIGVYCDGQIRYEVLMQYVVNDDEAMAYVEFIIGEER